MKRIDRQWIIRAKYLRALGTVYSISLSFFLVLTLFFATLVGQFRTEEPHSLTAATCTLPSSIDTTIELVPESGDNIIDCSAQDITITATGKLIIKSYKTADASPANDGGVVLKVGSLTVQTGGEISADGQGYTPGSTDGGSAAVSTGVAAGSGGGHGGAGGTGNTVGGGGDVVGATGGTIGNKDYPITLGGAGGTSGGGGVGGNGGGALKIEASGTVTIDGKISADGANGAKSADEQTAGGGGAGGSIWIEAQVLAGAGQVTAKGGGTDTSASYYGGGGGGGRIALICTASTTFPVGNVSVAFGTGSQNGQVGSLVGPGCKPAEPTILKFYEKNATTGKVDRELFVSELTSKTALTFAGDLVGSNLKLEIELREKSQSFTNTPTNSQITAASSKTCTGIPAGNGVTISTYCGYVEVTSGLATSTEYKWQARIVNTTGIASNWVQFGANSTSASDFTVVGAATSITIVEGNNQSVTVGQRATPNPKVRVVDAAGYGVPYYVLTSWSVLTGSGTLANSQLTADKWGEATTEWTIGTVAGVNNNSIRVSKTSPALSATFMASALPGAIASYQVVSQSSLSLINSPFTYTVTAVDEFGNVVPFTNTLTIAPVSSHNTANPGLGTLTPDTVLFSGSPASVPWLNPAWDYRKKITFDNTSASLGVTATTLTDFPVLLKLTTSNFDFSKAKSAGEDIRITDSDGTTQLPYEIEKWDSVGQVAYIWTKVPVIDADSANDFVYVYYGNPAAVSTQSASGTWDSSYKLVHHNGESSGTTLNDSTSNNNDGTKLSATEPDQISGALGGAQSFDGTNDKVTVTHNTGLNITSAVTIEAWVFPTENTLSTSIMRKGVGTAAKYHLYQTAGTVRLSINNVGYTTGGYTFPALNTWYHVVGTYDGANRKVYINGVLQNTIAQTGAIGTNSTALGIGYNGGTAEYYKGRLDEVRLSSTARSASWIAASYKTQNNEFTAFSPEETTGDVTTVYRDPSTGTITINTGSYSFSESIKLKVYDANGKVGYSNSILFVEQTGSCPAVTIDTNQTWNAVDVPGGIFDCRGLGPFAVKNGYTLSLTSYNNGDANYDNDFGATLLVDSFSVESGAAVTADGLGYPAGVGPSFESHGGYSTSGIGAPYGSLYEPVSLGSGGDYSYFGAPGAAGGAIKIVSTGNSIVDGSITANGITGTGNRYDGGAGGSIWIDTAGFGGAGGLMASGGNGAGINSGGTAWGSGGSGGRIAVYYSTNTGFTFDGTKLQAFGGSGNKGYSGAGTVYIEHKGVDTTKSGLLLVDNNTHVGYQNGKYAGAISGSYKFTEIRVKRGGSIEFLGQDSIVELVSGQGMVGDSTKPEIKISGTLNYTGVDRLTIDGVDLGVNGKLIGVQDITIGQTLASGMTLYANTWYHNNTNTYAFGDLIVAGNGTLTMVGYQNGAALSTDDYGVTLALTGLTVNTGGKITADGNGYPANIAVAGDVHGGYGGNSSGVPYGSVYEPIALGSGGDYSYAGTPGVGGGAIKLLVSGSTVIDGTISANGQAGTGNRYDGGAGGSIWLDTGTISGTGTFQTNGGAGAGDPSGGGSGGRIAVYYTANSGMTMNGQTFQAYGATGSTGYSGAGTVYIEHKGTDPVHGGTLLVDNNNHNGLFAGIAAGNYKFSKMQVVRYGHVEFIGDDSLLEIASGQGMVGDSTKPQIKVSGTTNYTGAERLTIDGVDLGVNGKLMGVQDITIGESLASGMTLYANTWYHNNINGYSFGDLVIANNGVLTLVSYQNGTSITEDDYGVALALTGLTVQAGGRITANGLGYPENVAIVGETHGGYSTNESGIPYGSLYQPVTLGSGGNDSYAGTSGAGGGAIKLTVSGNTVIDGTISANASVGSGTRYSGGAGGSIWLQTSGLSGSGSLQANGTDGAGTSLSGDSWGSGGSGGRIALYYATNTGFALDGTKLQAYGGNSSSHGYSGPGTVYIEHVGVNPIQGGTLLVDNNNHDGLYAGVPTSTYEFAKIQVTRYGHVEFVGQDSVIELASGDGMVGDSTKPEIKVSGTLQYSDSGRLTIDGVDLGVNGRLTGVQDVTVGETLASGVTLYAKTWYHNQTSGYSFGDVVISANGVLTVVGYQNGAASSVDDYGASIAMSGLTVATGGQITADGLGYPESVAVAGDVHGGYAPNSSGIPYGNLYEPLTLGSGGDYSYFGTPGAGGGAIKLSVSGTTLLNGTISANGLVGSGNRYDGGAGGSIWLDTQTLSGTGTIKANGGSGAGDPGGGGSGGRIAVYYSTNGGFTLDGTNLQSYGGNGSSGYAGPGTIYIERKGVDTTHGGTLLVDNNNNNGLLAGVTSGDYQFKSIVGQRYGHVEFMGTDSNVVLSTSTGMMGDSTKPQIKVSGTLQYTGSGRLFVEGVDLGINGKLVGVEDVTIGATVPAGLTLYAKTWFYDNTNAFTFGDVVVATNGKVNLISSQNGAASTVDDYGVALSVSSLTVQSGGQVTADGFGYPAGSAVPGSGDAHGGYSANGGGVPYGDIYEPTTLGSSGNNSYLGETGAGGGAVKLFVQGKLQIDGTLSANGSAGSGSRYDSGAGGSLWIDTATLAGSGIIQANGANGGGSAPTGGGSGGRVAVYYTTNENFLFDTAHVQAFGGTGSAGYSGPGTIYIESRAEHDARSGDLIIDNNSHSGRSQNFAAGRYTFNNVTIGQNVSTWVTSNPSAQIEDFNNQPLLGQGVLFVLSGNFTLSAGASINGQGMGFGPNTGPSKGGPGLGYSGGGGGGNGGNGGDGQSDGSNPPASGGVKAGDQLLPLSLGSGGGTSGAGALGGAGGAAFGVLAKGTLNELGQHIDGDITVAGTINMNGENGKTGSPGGGGGAGGSIILHGNTCDISGDLSAEGGEGGNSDVDGGSGGGGRVSILYNVGPCDTTGSISIAEGQPSDPLNYSASVGQEGTYPPEPNSVPWRPQYQEQFEVKEDGGFGSLEPGKRVALNVVNPMGDVLGITESSIPVGGIINGTTVTLKADVYDAGARPVSPKRLKIQVELKEVAEAFNATTGLHDSNTITFTGGAPVVLSVTINNLEMGTSYKWRVRTVNVDTGLFSDWEEFGGNSSDVADFTITTVANLEMELSRTSMELSEYASITLTARNTLGNIDSSYRGTVSFTSTSGTADLPASYTFTASDGGVHTFTNAVKFYEVGTFIVSVEDTINPALIDSASITVTTPEVPYVLISSSATNVVFGSQVTLSWQSSLVSTTSIDNGIGSVAASGSMLITPPLGTTRYTFQGRTSDDTILTASVDVTATEEGPTDVPPTGTPTVTPVPTDTLTGTATPTVTATPTITPTTTVTNTGSPTVTSGTPTLTPTTSLTGKPTVSHTTRPRPTPLEVACPSIVAFTVSNKLVKKGDAVSVSWSVKNADKIAIDSFSSSLPASGSSTMILDRPQDITLFARKGACNRTSVRHVEVVNAYPWEGAGGMLIGLLAIETIGMQIGAVQGNLWFALIGLIDRSKKRRPWGVVYNAVTKKLVARAVVRLWDAKSGALVDTVVTDANGVFKLAPRKGEYVLKVAAAGYTFPSRLVNTTADSGYMNIYTGEVIEVASENDILMLSIPLDPIKESRAHKAKMRVRTFFEELVGVISPIVLVAGFVYSVVVTTMYPLMLNFAILGLYGITFLVKAYLHFSSPRLFGMVTSVDGKAVSGLEIGLFDYEFKNLVSRTFTNKQGAYNFVVKNQAYYLQVLDSGYKVLSRHLTKEGIHIEANSGKGGVKLITDNLLVYPVQNIVKKKAG